MHNRREFLTGKAAQQELQNAGQRLSDQVRHAVTPGRGATVMLSTTAMACDFDVIMNPDGPADQVVAASSALDLAHYLEHQMSVYRPDAVLATVNRMAGSHAIEVPVELITLLQRANHLYQQTSGAFDPAAGALVSLWRKCRQAGSIPTDDEISEILTRCGMAHVTLSSTASTVAFDTDGVELNLGAIGKGFAVDRIGEAMTLRGVDNWLVHGGRSSVRANGRHGGHDGWPVGLRDPLLPDKPFATLLLQNEALGTSGTAVQWFRHEGKRYGHILDPRTGWPIESMLSVSVIAPDAALADALSTAFFVLGVENALKCCDNFPLVGAIFFPPPKQGRRLEPIIHNVPADRLFFEGGQGQSPAVDVAQSLM